ncbi:MAG: ParB/RepB/Spo0J family partition protein [Chloroflexota bacterium]|jgi:ParB family transcriptional regulator, chromosome partitioning protein
MARKKTQINLSTPVQPRGGDLDKLFATEGDIEQAAGLQLLALRLDAIDPDPDQPRSTFTEETLQELSASIRQDGVIQPIEVTELTAGRYLIVHGERRWRAAQLAGLTTIPAVVRRRDYDEVTRFVRQMVENIQREDLNDVDRAAGLLRLRKLMQEELDVARSQQPTAPEKSPGEPWGGRITWAKVGGRLGYSRQRIHQLIQLLDLPDEIKDAVRDGLLSERDTRIYQGLTTVQQRSLHRARMAGALNPTDVKQIARVLREAPDITVAQASRLLRQAEAENDEPEATPATTPAPEPPGSPDSDLSRSRTYEPEGIMPARVGRPTSIERLDWVRGHLARVDRQGLTPNERREMLRLLDLIRNDVASLIVALVQSVDSE